MFERITANTRGNVEEVTFNGRKYLVADSTLIVPGVLRGSRGPLYYPPDELGRDPSIWNGMPLVLYHPTTNEGQPVSARDPDILQAQGIGWAFRSGFKNRLCAKLYFDEELTANRDEHLPAEHKILPRLRAGLPIEVSTGVFTKDVPNISGDTFNGQHYTHTATDYRPDHIAVLPDQVGACSVKDGCGVFLTNAFCPTGEGGGRDNSCGSSGGGGSKKGSTQVVKPAGKASTDMGRDVSKDANDLTDKANKSGSAVDHIEAAKMHRGASAYLSATGDAGLAGEHNAAAVAHEHEASKIKKRHGSTFNARKKKPSSKLDISPDKACQIVKDGTAHEHPLTDAQRGMFGAKCGQRKKKNGNRADNAFCPTGEGGGRDNSCGKGGAKSKSAVLSSELKTISEASLHPDISFDDMSRVLRLMLDSASPGDVKRTAQELGISSKFKNKAEAVRSILQRIEGRKGAFVRGHMGVGTKDDINPRILKSAESRAETMAALPEAKKILARYLKTNASTCSHCGEGGECEDGKCEKCRKKAKGGEEKQGHTYNTGDDMDRAQAMQLLINCDCWKNDKATLEKMDDATIVKLAKQQQAHNELVANASKQTTPPQITQEQIVAAIKSLPPSVVFNALDPESQMAINDGRKALAKEKTDIIARLVALKPEADRAAHTATLNAKSLEDLRFMAEFVPAQTAKGDDNPFRPVLPDYSGAAPAHNASGADDQLPAYEKLAINWDDKPDRDEPAGKKQQQVA